MGMHVPAWSIQEYDAQESKRIAATELETEQFYYLAMPNRAGRPDAFRALAKVQDLQWQMGTLALGVLYFTRDLTPNPRGPQESMMQNDFWLPDRTLKLNFPNKTVEQVRVDIGYFVPYADSIDTELREIADSLAIPTGF